MAMVFLLLTILLSLAVLNGLTNWQVRRDYRNSHLYRQLRSEYRRRT